MMDQLTDKYKLCFEVSFCGLATSVVVFQTCPLFLSWTRSSPVQGFFFSEDVKQLTSITVSTIFSRLIEADQRVL